MSATHAPAPAAGQQYEVPVVRIAARRGWLALDLPELWAYRELLYFFVWRDIKVRYKQTVIGAAWAVLQPVLTMLVFSLFFGKLAKIPSGGLPYPIFYYCALLPWMYFATAMQGATGIVVENQRVITKIYFPRVVLPISSVLSGTCGFRNFIRRVSGHDDLLPYCSHEGRHLASRFYSSCGADGARCGLVAFRLECIVSGCPVRRTVPSAVLDVCLAGGLPQLPGPGKVALALRVESHGGRHRGISLGSHRTRTAARYPARGVLGCRYTVGIQRPGVLPRRRRHHGGCGLMESV